ncbi:MAG: cysteine hydrolase [Chloroflexi bacterium]|nr:MAG: cysteine hydrolase [Chloroflexota bacterium]TMG54003.1 MAG: cysteine hydrolase [Chloroflexota bacterium]
MRHLVGLIAALALVSACTAPAAAPSASPSQTTAAPSPTPTASAAPTSPIPKIPDPVAVEVPVKGAALLVLDITSVICPPRPTCVASVPKIAALVKKARDAKVPVIYSQTATAGSTYIADIAPQPGDATVTGRADKFYGTNLEQILKDKAVETAVVVGSAANGAVLYTTFGLGLRGITVVVAQDGISGDPEFTETLTRWQLLNEPGFANANNTPLDKGHVTLSTTDKITFK